MAAITKVRIEGFQSHVQSNFNLGNGLNVITGPSDAGKTAIIRAVRWVAFNEPQGEAFVNEKVGEAVVAIYLENGVIITKRRRKGKTSYLLQQSEDDGGNLFEKSEVPYEVQQALGISKQTFGDFVTALNFAFQLEAPFLISETASAGAKILGKLAGTEAVDLAIKDVSKDTYAARQERSQAEKEIEKIDYQLSEFMDLENLKEQLEACETIAQQIEADASKVDKLKQLKITYGTLVDQLERYQETLDRLAILGDLDEELKNIEAAQQRYEKLLTIYSQYNRTAAALKSAKEQLDSLEGIEMLSAQLESVEVNSQRIVDLKRLSAKLQTFTLAKEKAAETIDKMAGLEEVESLLEGIRKATERKATLWKFQVEKENVESFIESRKYQLTLFENLVEADSILQSAENDRARIMELRSLRAKHRLDTADVTQANIALTDAKASIKQWEETLAKLWEEAGGLCPLCDHPVGGHSH